MTSLAHEIRLAIDAAVRALLQEDSYRSYVGNASARLTESLSALHAGAAVELFSSGTAALETVLRAAEIGAGKEVVLAGYDYPGNFWAIERAGARPVLIDTLEDSWQIDLDQLEALAKTQNEIGAVVVSHLHGQLQPMLELRDICQRRGWLLIEDNCQALGSLAGEGERRWLAGTLGTASIVSFGGGKVFSAGRGGGLITQDPRLLQRVRVAAGAGSGPYALSELQAAVVGAQLPYVERLRTTVSAFFNELAALLADSGNGWICPMRSLSDCQLPYQFGLLVGSEGGLDEDRSAVQDQGRGNARDRIVHRLRGGPLLVGQGFEGFHRRGPRRCRKVGAMTHSARVAARTLVIHHRQALEGQFSPQALFELVEQVCSDEGAS